MMNETFGFVRHHDKPLCIDASLVQRLVTAQFPQWKDLPVWPVACGGWDNRTFHLGRHRLVRLPSAACYAPQVEKEHRWLPQLAPQLPLSIPVPLAMGMPVYDYPWKWSVYQWLEGDTVALASITDLQELTTALAQFLLVFQGLDSTEGPLPGHY